MRLFVPKNVEYSFIEILLEDIDHNGGKFIAYSKSQYHITKKQYENISHLKGIKVVDK